MRRFPDDENITPAEIASARSLLAIWFPACFVAPGDKRPKLALKVKIHEDVLEALKNSAPRALKVVRRAIRDYTEGPKYAACMKAGAPRINLDGEIVGEVTQADQDNAEWELKEYRKKRGQVRRDYKIIRDIQKLERRRA